MKNIASAMAALVLGLGCYQAHAVTVPLVRDAFWSDGFTPGVATPTQFMCTDYVSVSSPSSCVNYVGTTVPPWDEGSAQAALKFTLPQTSSVLSTARLFLKVMDRLGSPTATVTLTDDNNWIQTTSSATSRFPNVSGASVLLDNGSVPSTDWYPFVLTTSALDEKIVSSVATTATLIVTGNSNANTYFNFVADDDASGSNAYLSLSFKPQVKSVSVPANNTYKAGDALTFTVSFDSLVNVIGNPNLSLALNTGGTVQASYVSGSGSQNLVFRYTVASGDADADGVAVGSLALNGGTIRSDNYDDAELTLYSVGATTGVKVDAVVPAISTVAPPADGTYISGQNLDFIATFSEAVNVASGTPYITLTIGGVAKHAVYTSGTGTTALSFRYTLASGDEGALVAGSGITLNGGTIKDGAGNSATLTYSAPTTSGITVDAVTPVLNNVAAPSNGTYGTNQNLDFTATFSESVTVVTSGGTPYMALTIGGISKQAAYVSGGGTTALVFRYTLASGDAGTLVTGTTVTLNGGTIKDAAGNAATLIFSAPTTSGITVNTASPILFGVAVPSNGTYASSQNLDFTATFNEAVNVVTTGGTPYLEISIGGTSKHATYLSGTGTTSLVFRYAVSSGDYDGDGIEIGSDVLPNGGTIRGAGGVDADLAFSGSVASGVLVDARQSQVISFGSLATQTYGTEYVKLTAATNCGLAVEYESANPSAVAISNDTAFLVAADTATITARQPGGVACLAANPVSRILTVTPKVLSIVGATAQVKEYDGTTDATVTGAHLDGVVNSDDVSLTLGSASFATKDTGTAKAVTVSGSTLWGTKAGNYSLTEVAGLTADISPASISVQVDAQGKVYGQADPALSYIASPLCSGDAFTGALTRVAGEEVGDYAIDLGSLSAGGNYAISLTGANLTISQKPLTIAGASAQVRDYDGTTDATVSGAHLDGVVNSDDVSLTLGSASFATKDTGTAKAVTVSGSTLWGTKAGNYSLTEVSGLTASIAPKAITVNIDSKDKVYGQVDPSLTFVSTPLCAGDAFTGSLSRASGEDVGDYAIAQGSLSAGGNYRFNLTGANLTITQKPLTIAGASAQVRDYDGTTDATVSGAHLDGVVNSDDVSLTLGSASFATKDTGTAKAVTVSGSALWGTKAGNYSLTEVSGLTASIAPKAISVNIDVKDKVYGQMDPSLTFVSTPLCAGDAFTGSLSRASGEDVGDYAIAQGSLSAGGNYRFNLTGANLTITQKPLTIAGASAQSKVYDGSTDATVTSAHLDGVVNSDDVSLSLGRATFASKDVGPAQNVTVTGSTLTGSKSANYSLTEASGLIANIDVRPLVVSAQAKNKVEGSNDPVFTYDAPSLVGSDSWSGALSRDPGEDPGDYKIRQGTLSAGSNYDITFVDANLSISRVSALGARPRRSTVSLEVDAKVSRVFASMAPGSGVGALGEDACREDKSCQSIEVALPAPARVMVAIFDNMGTPVISLRQEVDAAAFRGLRSTMDGRRVLPLSWNLRSSSGIAVQPGVFLWKLEAVTEDGRKLETVKRIGVK